MCKVRVGKFKFTQVKVSFLDVHLLFSLSFKCEIWGIQLMATRSESPGSIILFYVFSIFQKYIW